MRLSGKTALITGAARGIGLAFARAYMRRRGDGWRWPTSTGSRRKAAAKPWAEGHAVHMDVTRQDSIDAGFAEAVARWASWIS
jgi:galactitol 2-dehydrogenase